MIRLCASTRKAHQYHSLAQLVRERGWPAGLEEFACGLERSEADRLLSECGLRHTCWKAFLNPEHRNSVLIVERGYGSVAVSLSGDFARVYALYEDPEQLFAVKSRVEWLGIRNIEFLKGTEVTRKLAATRLDALVFHDIQPGDLSPKLLDVVPKCLAPHAVVYAATGTGIRSMWLLFRLFRKLGIKPSRYDVFRYLSSDGLADAFELSSMTARCSRIRDGVARLVAPFRGPAVGIRASRQGMSDSLINRVLYETGKSVYGSTTRTADLVVDRYILSNPYGMTLVVRDTDRHNSAVVRIPFSVQAVERNEGNYQALAALHDNPALERSCFPKALHRGNVYGQAFYVESMVEGEPISGESLRTAETHTAVLNQGVAWIARLHASTAQKRTLDETWLERLVGDPLEKAFKTLEGRRGSDRHLAIRNFLMESFRGKTLNLVFAHGDYSVDNVLVADSTLRIQGVFDWDIAQPQGFPLLDLLYFLLSAERKRTGSAAGAIFREKLLPLRFTPAEESCVLGYCNTLDISPRLVFPLAIMAWVYHVAIRTHNPERYRCTPDVAEIAGDALPVIERLVVDMQGSAVQEIR